MEFEKWFEKVEKEFSAAVADAPLPKIDFEGMYREGCSVTDAEGYATDAYWIAIMDRYSNRLCGW